MGKYEEMALQLALVVAVGGLIGAEREYRSKSAGFRTMILICLGAYLFTVFSKFMSDLAPERIASNIVTGIGFLGAGVIFRSDNRLNGITTAATIWAVAALGVGIADGLYLLVIVSALIILGTLWVLTPLERVIDRVNQLHTYKIVSPYREDLLKEYEHLMRDSKLNYRRIKRLKNGDDLIGVWLVQGPERAHNEFSKKILRHPSVRSFEF